MLKFFNRGKLNKEVKILKSPLTKKQIINLPISKIIKLNKEIFIKFEKELIAKSSDDVEREIRRALNLFKIGLDDRIETLKYSHLIIIPPKYEFIEFLTLSLIYSKYLRTRMIFHPWQKEYIKKIKYLKQNKSLEFSFASLKSLKSIRELKGNNKLKIINFYQKTYGIPYNLEDDYLVYLNYQTDLDHVLEFLLNNAFNYVGLGKVSINKVVYDLSIKNKIIQKLQRKLLNISPNTSKILSPKLRENLQELVSESISEGGVLLYGSKIALDSNKVDKIILNNVTFNQRIFQKKLYAPLITLTEFDENIIDLEKLVEVSNCKSVIIFLSHSEEKFLKDKFPKIRFINLSKANINKKINNKSRIYHYEINLQIRSHISSLN